MSDQNGPLQPQVTANLKNFLGAVRAAHNSPKTVLRGPRLAIQDGNLMSATATYRDTENVWHDLAIAFLRQPDGSRRLVTDEAVQEPSPECRAAVKHLSEIVRSAIPVHREHVAAAKDLNQDPTEASSIIVRHLNDLSAGHLGYGTSAAVKNRHNA